jgi:ABC-type protease/lipase transport system fused ATPase/permease subunit
MRNSGFPTSDSLHTEDVVNNSNKENMKTGQKATKMAAANCKVQIRNFISCTVLTINFINCIVLMRIFINFIFLMRGLLKCMVLMSTFINCSPNEYL